MLPEGTLLGVHGTDTLVCTAVLLDINMCSFTCPHPEAFLVSCMWGRYLVLKCSIVEEEFSGNKGKHESNGDNADADCG